MLDSSQTAQPVDRRIYLSSALLAVMFASMAVLPTVLDEMVRQPFRLSNKDTSLFFQAGSLASVILGILAGFFSDRLGRRVPLIVVGLVLSGVCTILLPHMARFEWLLGMRFLDSALGTMAITLLMTRGVDLSVTANRSRTMGILMTAIPAGYILGPLVVLAVEEGNLGQLFAILGGAQVLGGFLLIHEWRIPEHVQKLSPSLGEMVHVVAGLPRTWLPMIFSMVDKFSFAAIVLLTPLFLADAGEDWGSRGVSMVMLSFFAAFFVASPFAGRLVALWGARSTVIGASILYGVAFVLMGSATSVPSLIVLMAVSGALTAFQFVPNMTLLGDLSSVRHRATVMAVFNTLGSIALLSGFVILGRMIETSYTAAYRLTGFLEIACGVVGIIVVAATLIRSRTAHPEPASTPKNLAAPVGN